MSKSPSIQDAEAHPVQAASAAAAAHAALAEALGMLREFTGGASLLQVEWELIQQLAQQTAQLFDDLDVWHANDLVITLPRRWWEPPWTATDHDPPLKRWEWQRAVRTRTVGQVVIGGEIEVDEEDTNAQQWSFRVEVYLLGRDGVLRWDHEYRSYARAEHPEPPLEVGGHGPYYRPWRDVELGGEAETLELANVGFNTTELLLDCFAELATATRDLLRDRIGRLREAGRLLPANGAPHGETISRLPS